MTRTFIATYFALAAAAGYISWCLLQAGVPPDVALVPACCALLPVAALGVAVSVAQRIWS